MMGRTKHELQKELDLTKNTLEKQKAQLNLCEQEKEKVDLEIETLKEEQARMFLKVRDMKPSEDKGEIKKLKTTLIALRKKLAKSELTDESSEPPSSEGNLPSPKANFQIKIWEPNGHYRAVIEHQQSKKIEKWGQVDQDALVSGISHFVSAHLPMSNEEEKLNQRSEPILKKIKIQDEKPKPAQPTRMIRPASSGKSSRINLKLLNKIIYAGLKFPIELSFGPGQFPEQNKDLGYKVSVYARRVGKGNQQLIDEFDGKMASADEFSWSVNAKILETGTYHLQAALITSLPGGPPVDAAFVKSSFFQVY